MAVLYWQAGYLPSVLWLSIPWLWFCQNWLNFLTITTNALNNCQRLLIFCQSGEILLNLSTLFFVKNGPSSASFSFYFQSFQTFQTNNTFLQQINVKKCPTSIRCWDSNSWTWICYHNHKISATLSVLTPYLHPAR